MIRPRARVIGWKAVSTALVVLSPASAQAHLVVSGLGPVYDGISHFVLSPEDFLPVVALGLFAGFRGSRQARALCCVVPLAWFAGGGLALMNVVLPALALSAATAALFLLAGGLLAAHRPVPIVGSVGFGILLGLLRGMADLAQVTGSGATVMVLIGICGTIFVVSALSASVTLSLRRLWMIVAARVCGSWIAALGLLLAGWVFRYGAIVR
jgi:hypothetical protein